MINLEKWNQNICKAGIIAITYLYQDLWIIINEYYLLIGSLKDMGEVRNKVLLEQFIVRCSNVLTD